MTENQQIIEYLMDCVENLEYNITQLRGKIEGLNEISCNLQARGQIRIKAPSNGTRTKCPTYCTER